MRRHQGDGGPLRRDPEDRIGGGLAAGLGEWRGFSPTTVRIAFVIAALATCGHPHVWMMPALSTPAISRPMLSTEAIPSASAIPRESCLARLQMLALSGVPESGASAPLGAGISSQPMK